MNIIAFDLEIAEPFPESGIVDHATLGISCAAGLLKTGSQSLITPWYDREDHGGMFGPRMTPRQCRALVKYLARHVRHGATLVTWNGHFDLQILAHECQDDGYFAQCQELALGMVDPMFQFLTQEGYCIGLEKVSLAMIGEKKAGGLHGADAPVLWKEGREEQEKVLLYVQGDAEITADVCRQIDKQKQICRYTQRGKYKCVLIERLLTVKECLTIPQPDTPWWVGNPWRVGGGQDRDAIAAWCLED